VVLQADAAIGALDIALALIAAGEMHPVNIGDLTLEEIDALTARLSDFVQGGHFDCVWSDEAEAVAAFSQGAPRIGSLWWTGYLRLRAAGVPVSMVTPDEGYRGWFGGLALSSVMDAAMLDDAYAYLNWWLDGAPGAIMARSGAYMSNPVAVQRVLSGDEWAFWYEGAPARGEIRDAEGAVVFRPGERREGGDYETRMARVRVWDTVMNEHNYLVRQWLAALNLAAGALRASASAGIEA
jgi:putative spermidine/putrescine transport system substrate-binding protein